jgi:hypothetical protein
VYAPGTPTCALSVLALSPRAFRHRSPRGLSDIHLPGETGRFEAARGAVFFRRVLETPAQFDAFVNYSHCGHNLGRECPPLFQDSRCCLRTPAAKSSLNIRSAFITVSHDVFEGPSRARLRLEPPSCRPHAPRRALKQTSPLRFDSRGVATSRAQLAPGRRLNQANRSTFQVK